MHVTVSNGPIMLLADLNVGIPAAGEEENPRTKIALPPLGSWGVIVANASMNSMHTFNCTADQFAAILALTVHVHQARSKLEKKRLQELAEAALEGCPEPCRPF